MAIKVLFVCLGNICRSPTAHGVMEHKIKALGLDKRIEVDSAGTAGWHSGGPPDARSLAAAKGRGYDLGGQQARQLTLNDFDEFDYILAMDKANLGEMHSLKPPHFGGHLGLFLDFYPQQPVREVPDPYHGGAAGFNQVLDLVEATCDALIIHLVEKA